RKALAPLQQRPHQRMRLEALEFAERRQPRIGIVEVDDEAERNQAVAEVIQERAAASAVVERPAERVLHQPRPMLGRIDLPELLEPDAEFLRFAAFSKAETRNELFGKRATRALADQRVFRAKFHATLETRFRRTVA